LGRMDQMLFSHRYPKTYGTLGTLLNKAYIYGLCLTLISWPRMIIPLKWDRKDKQACIPYDSGQVA